MTCKICEQPVSDFGKAVLLGKYTVQYFACQSCGFVQTEDPYWLEEAYANPINEIDIGLVRRNMVTSWLTSTIVFLLFNNKGLFLDFWGGYGLFTRMMRDDGFDFYHYEEYCENLFAKHFELSQRDEKEFEMVTAFEVFEHFVNPKEELEKILEYSQNILFSTNLLPQEPPVFEEWWYFGLEHGQHVSFYTPDSLSILADKVNLNFYTDGKSIHLFCKKNVPGFVFSLLVRFKLAHVMGIFLRRRSLLPHDFFNLTGKKLD